MTSNNGFIKLFRCLREWEWYSDINTKTLFIHLLLCSNYGDTEWKGTVLNRGQMIAGRKSLAKEIGLTEMQVRTSLKKLESTNDITVESFTKYTVITINNWVKYQGEKRENEQPTNNHIFNQMNNQQSNQMNNQQSNQMNNQQSNQTNNQIQTSSNENYSKNSNHIFNQMSNQQSNQMNNQMNNQNNNQNNNQQELQKVTTDKEVKNNKLANISNNKNNQCGRARERIIHNFTSSGLDWWLEATPRANEIIGYWDEWTGSLLQGEEIKFKGVNYTWEQLNQVTDSINDKILCKIAFKIFNTETDVKDKKHYAVSILLEELINN